MGLRFKHQQFGQCFFVTTSFFNHELLGQIPGVYDCLADSLNFCLDKCAARLPAYVFMPSHLHLLLVIDGHRLGNFMRDFKKFTSQRQLAKITGLSGQIWQRRYHRVAVYSERVFHTKLDYIHQNPQRAGLVSEATAWKWSSYPDYLGRKKGPLPVWKDWSW